MWNSHFVQVENDEQAENIDSSIHLEENPQAVSVDTSHLWLFNHIVIVTLKPQEVVTNI